MTLLGRPSLTFQTVAPYVAPYGRVAFTIAAKSRTLLLTRCELKPPIESRSQITQRAFV